MIEEADRAELRRNGRIRAFTFALTVMSIIIAFAAIVAVGYIALKNAEQSKQNYKAIQGIEEVNDRLLDCTEPGGRCFEDGQKRTGEAVTGITDGTLAIIVAAISCQEDGIVNQKELARCTVERASKMASKEE